MSLASRLDRLTPALSGKQRALLVTHAHHSGRDPEPNRFEMPGDQRREYDYFIALLYTSNSTLAMLLHSLTWIINALHNDRDEYAKLATASVLVDEGFERTPAPELVRNAEHIQR